MAASGLSLAILGTLATVVCSTPFPKKGQKEREKAGALPLPPSPPLLRTRPDLHSQKAERTRDARWASVTPAPGNFQGNFEFSSLL